MTDFPDVLGMEIHAATALLEAEGLPFIITETKPTKKEVAEGELRVIRVLFKKKPDEDTDEKNTIMLTVCKI